MCDQIMDWLGHVRDGIFGATLMLAILWAIYGGNGPGGPTRPA